eukprot:CAMPEP_0182592144 /NCGR_PEP_ID=MMETSP1324-20130603/75336_1 /TAXON_ID=236786 /ORGANISM="Florenciella sp., Strain RCC1587" /LENGTH=82 /DNA_ID=CAMNT_0024809519 /DNA_START=16 /DNA_END=260 /DNA_ORIENTATION=-
MNQYVRSFLSDDENEYYMLELTELIRLLSLLQEVLAVNQRLLDSSQVWDLVFFVRQFIAVNIDWTLHQARSLARGTYPSNKG